MPLHRRHFLTSSLAGMALSALPITAQKSTRKYRTALVGCGWWGMNILREAIAAGESSVVGMCDVDANYCDPAALEVEKLSGDKPRRYRDFRDLILTEKPEIVIVATPDHWHPLVTIFAVQNGAHVYVEKPICHTVREGRAMVNAARASGKMVQVGTHRRVSPHNLSGMEFLKSGKAGKIGMVRCFVHYGGGGGGQPTPDSAPPPGLDWVMWCGPAPRRAFNKAIHPKGFRNFLDYANGMIGDWGIHWMDQVLWWTEEKWPKTVYSTGGRYVVTDSTDAPDTQTATYQFESFTAVWEHRTYAGNEAERSNIGAYFYGTEGTFHMGWLDGWTFYPRDKRKQPIHQDAVLHKPDDQNIRELWADLLESVKNNRRPVSDIEIGQRSTNMSLLGMISWRVGRSIQWDGAKELIVGDEAANKLLSREYRAPYEYPKV